MKSSKGFFLLHELLCFGFCSILLATAAQGFTACFQVQQHSLELQEAWQVAQLAAAGVEAPSDSKFAIEQEEKEQNGYRYVEVRVYAKGAQRLLCNLLQSVP